MGQENQNPISNLEGSWAKSKNNYEQGNFRKNSAKRHGAYINDLHAFLSKLLETPEVESPKSFYRVDLKALSEAAKIDKADWATKQKQVVIAHA